MNQNELQKARIHSDFMKRAFTFYRIAIVIIILGAILIPQAFAVEDMWTAADRIIKDVYSKIAAISHCACRPDVCCRCHRCQDERDTAKG